jgi:ABC-2 type transport system permease protein
LKTLPWKRSYGNFITELLLPKWEKYFAIANLSLIHGLKNYKSLVGLSLFLVTCLIIFSHLWKIAAAKTGINSLDPDRLLWYLAFNEWVLIAIPDIQLDMEHDLKSGRLSYLLPRPISYLGSVFAEGLGTLLLNLAILGLVGFTFTWQQTGELPFSTGIFAISIGLGILAGITGLVYQVLIGISAFWLNDVSPFSWVWEKLLFIFGGLILPLSIYPGWMETLANWTPFASILGARSALALEANISLILWITLSLVIWSSLGILFLTYLYKKGMKILNIEGG